jgi:hypothetical protein
MSLCIRMAVTSRLFNAYLRRFLQSAQATSNHTVGRGSKEDIHVPCGVQERLFISNDPPLTLLPLGAYLPESLDKSQWCGADNTYTSMPASAASECLCAGYLLVLLWTSSHLVVSTESIAWCKAGMRRSKFVTGRFGEIKQSQTNPPTTQTLLPFNTPLKMNASDWWT